MTPILASTFWGWWEAATTIPCPKCGENAACAIPNTADGVALFWHPEGLAADATHVWRMPWQEDME